MSNKPNVDELQDANGHLIDSNGELVFDDECDHCVKQPVDEPTQSNDELTMLFAAHSLLGHTQLIEETKKLIAQAKQQTCDDIVGLVKNEMETTPILLRKMRKIQIEFTQWLIDNRNDCRTQTIDAINKYKREI